MCLQQREGIRPAREKECKSGRKWPLGRRLCEEELLSPKCRAAGKQGACKGVRSPQGPLSALIACKGCELLLSIPCSCLAGPSRRRGSKGHCLIAQVSVAQVNAEMYLHLPGPVGMA